MCLYKLAKCNRLVNTAMPFQPVPDAAQAIIHFTDGSRTWSNSWWFTKSGFVLADMTALATEIRSKLNTYLTLYLCNNFTQDYIRIYDQRAEGAPVYTHTANPFTGADADEAHVLGDALVATLRTATRGRSGRGRTYFSGASVGQSVDGFWSAGIQNNAITMLDALKASLGALGWTWVIASRFNGGVLRNPALTFPVTSFVIRSTIPGTQTRRNRRP